MSKNGMLAVSSSDDMTLKIWDLESGSELGRLRGHSDSLYSMALSDDSRRAVSVADDHTLKVWALETQAPIATFTCDAAASCCAFISDHEIIGGDYIGIVHFLSNRGRQEGIGPSGSRSLTNIVGKRYR